MTKPETRILPRRTEGLGASLQRISAMALRHWYLVAGSWPRVLDMAYWPSVQILLWGFMQSYLATVSGTFAHGVGVLLGAALLWDVFFRSQVGLTVTFLEEIWSRNLGHILVSPLRPAEYLASLLVVSAARTLIGLALASTVAALVFHFSILDFGVPLIALFLNLAMFGWTMGLLVAGLVLRYGQGAESLAWALAVGFAPLCAVYYPIATLPGWVQGISRALPPSHVFEGMRALVFQHTLRWDSLAAASALNTLYFSAAVVSFFLMLGAARRRGTILSLGE